MGSIMGVPAAAGKRAGAGVSAPCGQAARQSEQRVQTVRKSRSGMAPGGLRIGRGVRRLKRRGGAAGFSAGVSAPSIRMTSGMCAPCVGLRRNMPVRNSRRDSPPGLMAVLLAADRGKEPDPETPRVRGTGCSWSARDGWSSGRAGPARRGNSRMLPASMTDVE